MRPDSCPANKSSPTHAKDLRACHGPHIGVERFIGPADGNLTREPMMAAWSRPFRENVGNRAGITPVGELLTSGGMLFRGHHVWLGSAINGAGGVGSLLGLPALRLAGFYSLANSEFSTKVFTMPSAPLWLNADAHWTVPSGAPLDKAGLPLTCDEGCAACEQALPRAESLTRTDLFVGCLHEDVMVALHDTSGAVVPGYEKEACVFTHVDGTRLPLAWCAERRLKLFCSRLSACAKAAASQCCLSAQNAGLCCGAGAARRGARWRGRASSCACSTATRRYSPSATAPTPIRHGCSDVGQ